jgi:hypothetical protein
MASAVISACLIQEPISILEFSEVDVFAFTGDWL